MNEKEPVARLNLYDLLLLLAKWRKLFIVNFLLVVAIAVVIAMTSPVWYSATTVILPPSGGGGGLPSFLPSDLKGVAANFGLDIPTDEIYQTIFSSRSMKEGIIERFNLREVYEMSEDVFLEDIVAAFESHLEIVTRDDNAIVITVEDRSPELAAEMANGCVAELDRIYRNITSETARKNRIYIGRRLQQVSDSLASLQDSMVSFQKTSNVVNLSEQMFAMINAAADLKARQIATEVEMDVMRNSFGANHPMVAQLKATSSELSERYAAMLTGEEGDMFIGIQELPALSRQYAEIVRRVRIQNSLIEFIYPQYESSLIQEERETANVQIIDVARVPQRKSRPPRRAIVMIAAVGSFFATLVMVLLWDYLRTLREKKTEDWSKVQEIMQSFKRGRK